MSRRQKSIFSTFQSMLFTIIWTVLLMLVVQKNRKTACTVNVFETIEEKIETFTQDKIFSVDETQMVFQYWNKDLGNNKPVEINFGDESSILEYWKNDLPLKVITHGWVDGLDKNSGAFIIKTAYVDVGGFNIITVDWSKISKNIIYPIPAVMTDSIGNVTARFLDRLVDLTGINPSNIHLIGHSLGAHVVGSCGFHFKSGMIGRITGLDPAAPGFEIFPVTSHILSKENADFVDIIHTAGGTFGYFESLGHVDFYPNDGTAPQPGCGYDSLFEFVGIIAKTCSHLRSYELYAESVYNETSFIAVQCSSWDNFVRKKCNNNTKIPMGHGTIAEELVGNFYLKTRSKAPFAVEENADGKLEL